MDRSPRWTTPLGGDVTQWVQTSWIKALSDQTGFININNVRAGDPALEQRIVEEVASYGRQLGRIMEALDVVVGRSGLARRADLCAAERHALDDFSDLVRRVQALKDDGGAPQLTESGLDRMADELRGLKRSDPAAYRRIIGRLRDVVVEEECEAVPRAADPA